MRKTTIAALSAMLVAGSVGLAVAQPGPGGPPPGGPGGPGWQHGPGPHHGRGAPAAS